RSQRFSTDVGEARALTPDPRLRGRDARKNSFTEPSRREGTPPAAPWAWAKTTAPCGRLAPRGHLKAATRGASSAITRALSWSGVPAGSPSNMTEGLDQIGTRRQPPQLSL